MTRLLLTAVLAAGSVAVSAAPPAVAAVPVLARINLSIAPVSTTSSRICWDGAVDDGPFVAGVWTVAVTGGRSTGTTILAGPYMVGGAVLPAGCTTVGSGGAAAGAVHASAALTGVGADVTASCQLTAAWTAGGTAPRPLYVTCTDTAETTAEARL